MTVSQQSSSTVDGKQTAPRVHNYTVLPQKCALLASSNTQEQLEAAVFFRRILAAGEIFVTFQLPSKFSVGIIYFPYISLFFF